MSFAVWTELPKGLRNFQIRRDAPVCARHALRRRQDNLILLTFVFRQSPRVKEAPQNAEVSPPNDFPRGVQRHRFNLKNKTIDRTAFVPYQMFQTPEPLSGRTAAAGEAELPQGAATLAPPPASQATNGGTATAAPTPVRYTCTIEWFVRWMMTTQHYRLPRSHLRC